MKGIRQRDAIPGKTLRDNFTIVGKIGSGGVSDVYLARQRSVGNRNVAVKVLRKLICTSESEEATVHKQRFKFEAELLCMLKSGCFARVIDVGVLRDEVERPYMVMEYLAGVQLSEHMSKGQKFPLPAAAGMTLYLGEALEELHRFKVVYRDLSPANIIIEEGGAHGLVPRLFDLSHAVVSGVEAMAANGAAGRLLVGTPPYAAPELSSGHGGESSDVYSLAALFYAMVTGEPPLDLHSSSWEDYLGALALRPRIPARLLKSELKETPRNLDVVLAGAMQFRPERRYQSMREFMVDFCEVFLKSQLVEKGVRNKLLSNIITRFILK